MNAVIGMTNLILSTALSEEQRQYVETIRTSGDALLSIIDDILDLYGPSPLPTPDTYLTLALGLSPRHFPR